MDYNEGPPAQSQQPQGKALYPTASVGTESGLSSGLSTQIIKSTGTTTNCCFGMFQSIETEY